MGKFCLGMESFLCHIWTTILHYTETIPFQSVWYVWKMNILKMNKLLSFYGVGIKKLYLIFSEINSTHFYCVKNWCVKFETELEKYFHEKAFLS